ncbi:unnamed protein product [Caenorhabditis angaria]|uniref:Domain of unknown function DB domain-containing protein n=1 Tax=Caenorhabditis angaria TaxID=860376 RepID=A0A9P1I5J4_9PELO|nr:unnamed protein product [Caenorhabditis angaria]
MKSQILFTLVIFVSTGALGTTLPSIIRNAKWECGADDISKFLAELQVKGSCPELRDDINSCCLNHDKCYDDKKGQEYCDDIFCNCMEVRTRPSKECNTKSQILFTLVIFVTTGALGTTLPPIIRNANWECGADDVSKYLAELQVKGSCPELRDEINSCCLNHDKCYADRKGQKYCDDIFCNCMEVRTRSSKECHDKTSPAFCKVVQIFGHTSYEQGK